MATIVIDYKNEIELYLFKNKAERDQFWNEANMDECENTVKAHKRGINVVIECSGKERCFCKRVKNKPVIAEYTFDLEKKTCYQRVSIDREK